LAQNKNGPGVTDTEILIGQTNPYSGPLSAYGTQGRAESAYYNMINEEGGVNGRKIRLLSLDDGYSPPKTVEQHRRLVEGDEVLGVVGTMGTPTNSAIVKYMNSKSVPHIFIATGASKWGDYKDYPWTMGWYPTYRSEGAIYGKYVRENIKDAKVAILSQNDDYGKDFVAGFKAGLGDAADKLIVKELTYEVSEGFRCQRALQRIDRESGGANDPQGRRTGLASDALPRAKCQFDLDRSDAGRPGELKGVDIDGLYQGSRRSAVCE